ncbi:YunF [Bacillus freudenreichii]|nr:YunF [Bacillus freudenreichii]
MIYIGVTGWGDHDIYHQGIAARDKLKEYAAHFPTVEVDASFYAVQPARNVEKWVKDTPADFQFVVKAYQGMTGHQRGEIPFSSKEEMFDAFKVSLTPYVESGKLAMVLFQFPPWFDCKKENVAYLRYCRDKMDGYPVALEFRNQSWFWAKFRAQTLRFMEAEGWIHSICDEPQVSEGSIPTVLKATDKEKTLVRMHGRNTAAWMKPNGKNWREVRYLYRYNKEELLEWKENILKLQNETKDIYILFNNNSGGDAAGNAKEFIQLMDIKYEGLAAKQLDLF